MVRAPDYWEERYQYGVLNKTGRCQWVQPINGVSMIFDNCLERLVPPYCLEPVANPNRKIKNAVEELNENTVEVGKFYLVNKEPFFYKDSGYSCPVLGKFGELVAVRGKCCLLLFGKEKHQHLLPFECLTLCEKKPEKKVVEIPDGVLIMKMIDNPEGVLKIIRGLAKMNKDYTLRTLLEKGTIV